MLIQSFFAFYPILVCAANLGSFVHLGPPVIIGAWMLDISDANVEWRDR